MAKKIGILGSGQVGQVLANGFIKHGYTVMIGTSNPSKLSDWKQKAGANAHIGSFSEAAAFGDIVVLAVKGDAAMTLIGQVASALHGKTVLDTTNPIAEVPPHQGVLKFFTTLDDSLMERLQKKAPTVNFVKAFNSVGSARMVNPSFQEGKPTMFICGDNDAAKKEATLILDQFGWDVADFGKAESARAIEPLCILWCIPGFLNNQWTHAFKLVRE
ncbi:MAG TPA: NAD(P)-binding domain-containing protein [Ohtaekwangia sp.]|uniref:NADPH-dependent F420 reductase n=2 Tax=Ohtaekwangia sp. TaxID=2066019 RepID=UPI002F95C9C0